jgi:transcriptional regulator with XRE-family HTH domain
MPARRSPTVGRRRLGIELRLLREASGLTIEQVATNLDCSTSKISRIETGHVPAKLDDVRKLLRMYEAPDQQREHLTKLASDAQQQGWWHQRYRDLPHVPLIGLEDAAASISTYQQSLVPGLLQIEEYARAVLRAVLPDRQKEAERRLSLRMARQRLLGEEGSPNFWAILDEAVLRRQIGGRDVLKKQLQHLLEIADATHVNLQVLPFEAGEHAGVDGGFSIINFRDPLDPDVVYLEYATENVYIEDVEPVDRYVFLFGQVRNRALSLDESVEFLRNVISSL